MEMNMAKFSEKLQELVELGKKKKNVLEYQEINDHFKEMPLDPDALDKVFDYLESCGIDVLRIPDSDEDVFIISDDDGINLDEEEEVDVENIDLSVPEGVSIEDPVRMYLRRSARCLFCPRRRRSSWQSAWKRVTRQPKNVWQRPT